MMQTDVMGNIRGGAGVWVFRVLLVAAGAFMVYSWFAPWWSATVAGLPGKDQLVMRPWGGSSDGPGEGQWRYIPVFDALDLWTLHVDLSDRLHVGPCSEPFRGSDNLPWSDQVVACGGSDWTCRPVLHGRCWNCVWSWRT